ncbi:hypothetical protein LTR27_011382 [Elasticomyces elasticus]|nr:hypothetical protein LTR27_011382 [Elasticomyces elasticus]
MADHLAATYLDRVHDAERTTLQLKIELQAARAEVKAVKDAAATESAAHTRRETGLERNLTQAQREREELRSSLDEAKSAHESEVEAMWAAINGFEAETAALKKKLRRAEAEKVAITDMYDELREKSGDAAAKPASATTIKEEAKELIANQFPGASAKEFLTKHVQARQARQEKRKVEARKEAEEAKAEAEVNALVDEWAARMTKEDEEARMEI